MGDSLTCRGYTAIVSYDAEGACLYGTVSGIRDKVYFESESAREVSSAFHEAVDDYLDFCAAKGKDPERPFKGSFNVRIGSALHERAALKAADRGESLNQFVMEAIAAAVQMKLAGDERAGAGLWLGNPVLAIENW